VWWASVVDGAEVAAEGVGDALVSGVFVGPAALSGVVAQLDDVGELGTEHAASGGVGDVVIALLADVGVGACAGGEVSAAVAVRDACRDHLAVEPVDVVGDELARGPGDEPCGGGVPW